MRRVGHRYPRRPLVVQLAEQLLGLAPPTGRDAQRQVAAAVPVERPIRGQDALDAGVLEVPPPCQRAVQILEVAHHFPAVEAGVADVDARLSRTGSTPPQHGPDANTA